MRGFRPRPPWLRAKRSTSCCRVSTAAIASSSGLIGANPAASIAASSMNEAYQSPIFCVSLPFAARVSAAASSRIRRVSSRALSCSAARPPASSLSAGISVRSTHLPLTYRKKSSPGLTLASMPVRSMPQAPFSGLLDWASRAAVAGASAPIDERSADSLAPPRAIKSISDTAVLSTKPPRRERARARPTRPRRAAPRSIEVRQRTPAVRPALSESCQRIGPRGRGSSPDGTAGIRAERARRGRAGSCPPCS